jgi:hypothetical protein
LHAGDPGGQRTAGSLYGRQKLVDVYQKSSRKRRKSLVVTADVGGLDMGLSVKVYGSDSSRIPYFIHALPHVRASDTQRHKHHKGLLAVRNTIFMFQPRSRISSYPGMEAKIVNS